MHSVATTDRSSEPRWALAPEASSSHHARRLVLSPLIPILIVYFGLAFYRIDHQSLWVDEVRSLESADPDGSLFNNDILFRGQGPLYFMLLHFWAKVSTSEAFLRALSTLLGGIAVSLVYALGLQVLPRKLAAIGTIFFATSPFLIWYSQEVRYVILMVTLALLTMAIFRHATVAKPRAWWLIYFGSLIVALSASPLNIFLIPAHGLYIALSPARRPLLRRWAFCQLGVLVFFVWWANAGYVGQVGGYWQRLLVHMTPSDEALPAPETVEPLATGNARGFTPMALPYTLFSFSAGFSLGPSLQELHVSRSWAALRAHALLLALSGLVFGSLFLLGLATRAQQPEVGEFLTTWLAVPVIAALGVSWLIPSLAYNVRYVAMSFPSYSLMLAAGLGWFKRPVVQTAAVVAVLLVHGLSLANYYFDPRYSREDARSAVRFLLESAQPTHPILVVGNELPLQYYSSGRLPLVSWGRTVIDDQSALLAHLDQLRLQPELWLVTIRPWEDDPQGLLKAALDARHRLIERQSFPGIEIYAYRLD